MNVATKRKRTFGIFAPIRSLPTDYCIGTLGKPAYEFVDWLANARQTDWLIWPFNYSSDTVQQSPFWQGSAFAGNTDLIDPYLLKEEGLIDSVPEVYQNVKNQEDQILISYEFVHKNQETVLLVAFENARSKNVFESKEYKDFCSENSFWLEDYAFYMAYKQFCHGASIDQWETRIQKREKKAMENYRKQFKDQILFYKFCQFVFFKQLSMLKRYANEKGIRIIVDIPFYVAPDSVDVWQHPELFVLWNNTFLPVFVGGCPPDNYSEDDGQKWGFPVYNWEKHKETGFEWLISRFRHLLKYGDIIRVDHFRGYDAFYQIHACEKSAKNGKWISGPKVELFKALKEALGNFPMILEDLGTLDEGVYKLRDDIAELGFEVHGMKVAVWGWTGNEHTPRNWTTNVVGMTSTHDSESVVTSIEEAAKELHLSISEVLGIKDIGSRSVGMVAIEVAYKSKAEMVIIPLNDVLSLHNRFNKPATIGKHNWSLRFTKKQLSSSIAHELSQLVEKYS